MKKANLELFEGMGRVNASNTGVVKLVCFCKKNYSFATPVLFDLLDIFTANTERKRRCPLF
jgi:hypothetical protein